MYVWGFPSLWVVSFSWVITRFDDLIPLLFEIWKACLCLVFCMTLALISFWVLCESKDTGVYLQGVSLDSHKTQNETARVMVILWWLFLGLEVNQILSKCGAKLKLHHSALGKRSKRGYLPLIRGMPPPVVHLWALPYKNMPFESGNTYETLKCLFSILTPNSVKVLILSSTWRFQAKI